MTLQLKFTVTARRAKQEILVHFAMVFLYPQQYTAKNAQFVTSLFTFCNNLLLQADIRIRSHGLQQLATTSLLQVVNRLVANC